MEVRERVEQIAVRVAGPAAPPPLFARTPEPTLLLCGVPADWLADVRAATEDTLLDLADHLPAEALEALINLSAGIAPAPAAPTPDPFAHPDAQRRFRLLTDSDELARALDYPWERWTVWLHPAQRSFVDRDFAGPARITGSAGTGKTVVALHRAVRLARADPAARVLLTTFNDRLADGLRAKLALLAAPTNVAVSDLRSAALAEHGRLLGPVRIAAPADVAAALAAAADGAAVDPAFLRDEWRLIVDARDVRDAAACRDLPRHGRRTRLTGDRRDALWTVFAGARAALAARGLKTYAEALHDAAAALTAEGRPPFDHVVVDEAQDLALAELRFLKAACAREINGLFFAGDIGQRIFRPPFAWAAEGVEIRGRSRSLKVNYRTSRQIRRRADLLLPPRLVELDGSEEDRTGVQSVFDGPAPLVRSFPTPEAEIAAVAAWLAEALADGVRPEEIAVLVRSRAEFPRAERALAAAGQATRIPLSTMHEAKGREFRAVAVMACDAAILPSRQRLAQAADPTALEEIFLTERHLVYVAATRPRDRLLTTAVAPVSEFLIDLVDPASGRASSPI